MNLYFPPLPFDPAALQHALQRMRDFNGNRAGRIIFMQEDDALRIAREGLEISHKWEEFIFDRAAVIAQEGSSFGSLRQELSRALVLDNHDAQCSRGCPHSAFSVEGSGEQWVRTRWGDSKAKL